MLSMLYAFGILLLVGIMLVSSVILFKIIEKEDKTKEVIILILMTIVFILNYPNFEKYQIEKTVKIKCEVMKKCKEAK